MPPFEKVKEFFSAEDDEQKRTQKTRKNYDEIEHSCGNDNDFHFNPP